MKDKILILVMIMFVFSCKTNVNDSKIKTIEPNVISKGNLYGSGKEGIVEQNLVVTNESDWNDLMFLMNAVNDVTQSFSETKIDFDTYTIIAVFDKLRTSGGYSIELEVETKSDEIIVNTMKTSPEGNASAVMTQPYCIVKIVKSNLPIVFK
ncbi:protease complex subunit PrcB family protein [uncultured Winogradskyella sp.]|uniref:protease complex subunit PrcB family protein n=1 Tax=uncultured Winogradskyella sp. TaxID=395353 RepID=UPI0030D83215|tara:strand:+ start:3935 stop:4390 length:456 start_codon:yes stop_codon:yes gene_type:complete